MKIYSFTYKTYDNHEFTGSHTFQVSAPNLNTAYKQLLKSLPDSSVLIIDSSYTVGKKTKTFPYGYVTAFSIYGD